MRIIGESRSLPDFYPKRCLSLQSLEALGEELVFHLWAPQWLALVWHLDQTNLMLEGEVIAQEELPRNKGSQPSLPPFPIPVCLPECPLTPYSPAGITGIRQHTWLLPWFSGTRILTECCEKWKTSFPTLRSAHDLEKVNLSDGERKNWEPSHSGILMSLKSLICHRKEEVNFSLLFLHGFFKLTLAETGGS